MLESEAFGRLMQAYLKAQGKGLTECTVLKIEADPSLYLEAGKQLSGKLRQTDYIGMLEDGGLYTLLPNTAREDAHYVIKRFAEAGYNSRIVDEI